MEARVALTMIENKHAGESTKSKAYDSNKLITLIIFW